MNEYGLKCTFRYINFLNCTFREFPSVTEDDDVKAL